MKHDLEAAKQAIAKAASPEERLRVLLESSKNFYRSSPKDAAKWAREALAIAKKLKDAEGIAWAQYNEGCAAYQLSEIPRASKLFAKAIELDRPEKFKHPLLERPVFALGLTVAKQGKYKEAVQHYARALALARTHGCKSEIDILTAMGNAALEQGNYPKALEYQYQSLAILDKTDDPLRRVIVLGNIGRIYLEVQDLDRADSFFERSALLATELDDFSGLAALSSNRGMIAQARNDLIHARKFYGDAQSFAKKAQSKDIEAYLEERLGQIEFEQGRAKKALGHYQKSLKIAQSLGLQRVWCASLIGLGRAQMETKQATEAIGMLKQSLKMSQESGMLDFETECSGVLAKSYEAKGRLKESIVFFNRFVALNAELHSQQRQRSLVEIQARVEIEKADRERARMESLANDANQRADLLRAETERQSKELTTLALHLVEKNEFLCNLKEEIGPAVKSSHKAKSLIERIDSHIRSDRDWETFENQFDQVHHDFLKELSTRYPALTPAELKIAVMMTLNLPTKAIASLFCLSNRTVESHRLNIRRKLALKADANLVSFLTGFGR